MSAGCAHKKARLPQPAADTPNPATYGHPPDVPLNPSPESLPVMKPPPTPEPAPAPTRADEGAGEQKAEPQPVQEKRTPSPRRVAPRPDAAVEGAPVSPPPAPVPAQPTEVPRLAPILSDGQMKELNQAIDAALVSAEQNLRAVRSRDRNTQQQKMLEQAEGFARQAREFRGSDLVSAKSFADKADQLSRELVSTYR